MIDAGLAGQAGALGACSYTCGAKDGCYGHSGITSHGQWGLSCEVCLGLPRVGVAAYLKDLRVGCGE
jgi:hypothetical protein